jgi:D-alanyl-lipoteichoic acid acyltransferase DltB (MBOAT superfamily)
LEYYSHIFFFPTFLVGPNFTFNMYNKFIHRKNTPSAVIPVLAKLGQAVVCYMFVIAAGFLPVEAATKDEFRQHNILWRIVYIWIAVVCYRFKYYFIWSLCEGAATATGLSYNGKAKTAPTLGEKLGGDVDSNGDRWDLVKAVHIAGVELAPNVKSITDNWNMTVARFLRVYVYSRLTRPNQGKPGNTNVYITQLVSACWHGFYPGYYMFFVSTSGVVATARLARTLVRPIFAERFTSLKPLYDVLTWICTVWVLNILGAAFIVLDFWAGWALWRNVWFFSHVASWVAYGLLTALKPQLRAMGPPPPKKAA